MIVNNTKKTISSVFIPAKSNMNVIVHATAGKNETGYIKNNISLNIENGMVQKNIETYTKIESEEERNNKKITGAVYVDTNSNHYYDISDEVVGGVIVDLYDSETDEKIDSSLTDMAGRYEFENLENKKYLVKFNYNEREYVLSRDTSAGVTQNTSSVINVENKYVTNNINVEKKSVSNVDLGLSKENIFDLKLDLEVAKMTVQNSSEVTQVVSENGKLSKIDIDPKLLNDSRVLIEYKITVINQGTISGTASKIVDYIPDGMEFDSSLNPDWYIGADGNIYTHNLDDITIEPGEMKELRLILVRNVTETNTGLLHNTCEIEQAINSMGIADIDSNPGNKLDEDDYSYADSIIGVSTGLPIDIIPIILVSIICIISIAILIWKVIDKRRNT